MLVWGGLVGLATEQLSVQTRHDAPRQEHKTLNFTLRKKSAVWLLQYKRLHTVLIKIFWY